MITAVNPMNSHLHPAPPCDLMVPHFSPQRQQNGAHPPITPLPFILPSLPSFLSSLFPMAATCTLTHLFTIYSLFFVTFLATTQAQVDEAGFKLMTDALEWPLSMSMYGDLDGNGEYDDGLIDLDGDDEEDEMGRRSLFWKRMRYYISYGALVANRIPCPPRSGRSYYTHNCFKARTPVNPYRRGCSRITRCRR